MAKSLCCLGKKNSFCDNYKKEKVLSMSKILYCWMISCSHNSKEYLLVITEFIVLIFHPDAQPLNCRIWCSYRITLCFEWMFYTNSYTQVARIQCNELRQIPWHNIFHVMTMLHGVVCAKLEINVKHNPNFVAKLYSLTTK